MEPYDQNIVTFHAMFVGYVDALNRFEVATRDTDPVLSYTAMAEALNWAVALDERTRAHFVPNGRPVGYGWRDMIPNGEIMGGVSFARNSVHHDWSDAMEPRSGREGGWAWRAADDLPPPSKPQYADNEAMYRNDMEGRPVWLILDVLGGVFLTLQHLLEPYTMPRGLPSPAVNEYPFPAMEAGITP